MPRIYNYGIHIRSHRNAAFVYLLHIIISIFSFFSGFPDHKLPNRNHPMLKSSFFSWSHPRVPWLNTSCKSGSLNTSVPVTKKAGQNVQFVGQTSLRNLQISPSKNLIKYIETFLSPN